MDCFQNYPMDAMMEIHDLKKDYGDFCALWECRRFHSHKACTYCPVIKDINEMVCDQQLKPASWLPAYSIY